MVMVLVVRVAQDDVVTMQQTWEESEQAQQNVNPEVCRTEPTLDQNRNWRDEEPNENEEPITSMHVVLFDYRVNTTTGEQRMEKTTLSGFIV